MYKNRASVSVKYTEKWCLRVHSNQIIKSLIKHHFFVFDDND